MNGKTNSENSPKPLQCSYYQQNKCRSCTLITMPYELQLMQKSTRAAELIPTQAWLPPVPSQISHFRNKVKLVVSGSFRQPKLGIINQDLRHCQLPTIGIQKAIPMLAEFVQICELTPYNFKTNTGVLKYILITESPNGELMVRFVVRRRGVQGIIFKRYNWLQRKLPQIRVCSINVQPERKAIIEGTEEILVSAQKVLPMQLEIATDPAAAKVKKKINADANRKIIADVNTRQEVKNIVVMPEKLAASAPETVGAPEIENRSNSLQLFLQAKSFFQTNTLMAQALYTRAAAWISDYLIANRQSFLHDDKASVYPYAEKKLQIWDLYCGVGGFALAAGIAANETLHSGLAAGKIKSGFDDLQNQDDNSRQDHSSVNISIYGVETSSEAVEGAQKSARQYNLPAQFIAADAAKWAQTQLKQGTRPDIIIVNPPRCGIGEQLAEILNRSETGIIIYSSCNVESLAKDLLLMPSYVVRKAQIIDMFPNTEHFETVCLLSRVEGK